MIIELIRITKLTRALTSSHDLCSSCAGIANTREACRAWPEHGAWEDWWPPSHSTGSKIWPLPMLFLNCLWNNIFWKKYSQRLLQLWKSKAHKIWHFAEVKHQAPTFASAKYQILHFFDFCSCKSLCKYFFRKYYFTNYLKITLAEANLEPCAVSCACADNMMIRCVRATT